MYFIMITVISKGITISRGVNLYVNNIVGWRVHGRRVNLLKLDSCHAMNTQGDFDSWRNLKETV